MYTFIVLAMVTGIWMFAYFVSRPKTHHTRNAVLLVAAVGVAIYIWEYIKSSRELKEG